MTTVNAVVVTAAGVTVRVAEDVMTTFVVNVLLTEVVEVEGFLTEDVADEVKHCVVARLDGAASVRGEGRQQLNSASNG